ncbi:toxin-antitoxin system HicB family antitoxin [Roseimaritima sediminicola]|uniref:toxin-antitoxin system HicB family antitoxin n=1 Tax=Roseimaritima sediminicola TaxID=2662066 RepID=UPI00129851C5|nr:toxin-antitoxin system HicB family antitoxin [Roseimaritima sediminicola]
MNESHSSYPHPSATSSPSATTDQAARSAQGGAAAEPTTEPVQRLELPAVDYHVRPEQRADEVLRVAREAFPTTDKWILFYRGILGADGVARKMFPSAEAMRQFEQSPQFDELLEMTAAMRSQDPGKGDELEPQKMITVRLPKSQHEALKLEAGEHRTSINKLCISKLLLPIKEKHVPKEKGKVRGRKPGPQGPHNRLTDVS